MNYELALDRNPLALNASLASNVVNAISRSLSQS